MTSDQLIAEGRRLERPSVLLRATGNGPVVAFWHEPDDDEIESTGLRRRITVEATAIPNRPSDLQGLVSILTDEKELEFGTVEILSSVPKYAVELRAYPESVLPPVDAVFARGSEVVGDWLTANRWRRDIRYNDNFPDRHVVEAYEKVWFREYPIYREDVYAALGGWHWPCADDDWHDLIDGQLLVMTVRDSEPWVEGWRFRTGKFKVIQRIT
jgi:hypothetical protein